MSTTAGIANIKSTNWKSISQLAAEVQSGETTAEELVTRALKAIDEHQHINAIISIIEDRAMERAKSIDEKVKKGENAGRLAGVPFIAKDNFLTFGSETTAASNILKGFNAPYQATAIDKLEAEGAICVAKANMDAFGHGTSTENSDFMVTKNPHDDTRVAGGSSGGSAASVVLNIVPFAIGTDTGGSSRQPASFSGCVGFKPTYGLISRSGVIAMASSTDTVGVLTTNTKNLGIVVDVLAGKDGLDSTSIERDPAGYTVKESEIKSKKIGLIKEYISDGVDKEVKNQILQTVDKLKRQGVQIVVVSLPSLPLALACYYILIPAEVSSNLSRYDGQRYGYSEKDAVTIDDSYNLSRSTGFGAEAKRRIIIGTFVLSSGYYDAYYKKAQQLRTKLINEFNDIFKEVDFLIGPVAPTPAFKIGENVTNPMQMYMSDILSVAANLTGVPAISIPAGNIGNLPVGLQIMAPQREDRQLIAISNKLEKMLV